MARRGAATLHHPCCASIKEGPIKFDFHDKSAKNASWYCSTDGERGNHMSFLENPPNFERPFTNLDDQAQDLSIIAHTALSPGLFPSLRARNSIAVHTN